MRCTAITSCLKKSLWAEVVFFHYYLIYFSKVGYVKKKENPSNSCLSLTMAIKLLRANLKMRWFKKEKKHILLFNNMSDI